MTSLRSRLRNCLAQTALGTALSTLSFAGLSLQPAATSPYDLAVTGSLLGLPPGETAWVRWTDLRSLPVQQIEVDGEFVPGPQKVTAVFLSSLMENLPLDSGTSLVLAECGDGYLSVFDKSFVAHWKPFIVLEIDGRGPDAWPPAGLTFNPGPYVITVSEALMPGVTRVLDIDHKKPWGVRKLTFGSESLFSSQKAEAWRSIEPHIATGRTLWINSCLSCHAGPGETLGGTKSGRPFAVLAAYATHNPAYVRQYVRDPKALNPAAKMTPHPHYSDEELGALLAFMREGAR